MRSYEDQLAWAVAAKGPISAGTDRELVVRCHGSTNRKLVGPGILH